MKAWSRIEDADNDATIAGNIIAARRRVEHLTHRAFITQTATLKLSNFPLIDDSLIELIGGVVQSVTSIQYVDSAGSTQTWASSEYVVDSDWEPGRISPAFDKVWPTVREWGLPVTITYVVGYGDDPGDVPEEIRTAIKILAAEIHENREETVIGSQISAVPWGVKSLADPYRVIRMI